MVLRWTRPEDDALIVLVKKSCRKFGKKQWIKIARQMGKKDAEQCERRWKELLNSRVKKMGWSNKEDEQELRRLVKFAKTHAKEKKIAKRQARQIKLIQACRRLIKLVREQRANNKNER
uniref:HTH myb-type domain-containing protein n=1 Tax=Panagrellus redivivus TaxID=6233 RepID=A0A7E5A1D8_PANRE